MVLLVSLAGPSLATSLRVLGLDELVQHSDVVVAGKCVALRTEWMDKKIYTVATVQVQDSAKGTAMAGQSIEVYMLGGRVRKPIPVKMHVPGAAIMAIGEEAILFLEGQPAPAKEVQAAAGPESRYRFVGMQQGKIKISVDPNTGRREVALPMGKPRLAIPVPRETEEKRGLAATTAAGLREAVANNDGSIESLVQLIRAVHTHQQALQAAAEQAKP